MQPRTGRRETLRARPNGNGKAGSGRCRTDGEAARVGFAATGGGGARGVDHVTVTCREQTITVRLDGEAAELDAGQAAKLSIMLRDAAVQAIKREQARSFDETARRLQRTG